MERPDWGDFWQGRRVFLTGHTGFKGSWLTCWLLRMGAQVRGFALAPEMKHVPNGYESFFSELGLQDRMDHIIGDIRDEALLRGTMMEFRPEIVMHLAAQPLVRASYVDPVETYATNVMGTVHLLNSCRDISELRSIVVVSSDKCYENREQIWGYRETDRLGGHDPYSNSKGCTELIVKAFRASWFPSDRYSEHGVSLTTARAGNVIGGGDWSEDRLICDAARARLEGRTLEVRFPNATRPWQHVLEPLSGYLQLAELGAIKPDGVFGGWNFGPDSSTTRTVAEVLDGLARRMGPEFKWQVNNSVNQPHEAGLLALDCTKAFRQLGWQPKFDWAQTLDMTAAWYSDPDPESRRSAVHDDIEKYNGLLIS